MSTFSIGQTDFLRDGAPHRILSGAIHYFRVHPDLWADRIRKAKLMGLNTIETYVAWNAHEPRRGEWDVTGANDLGRFLDLIAAEGMDAIVRPGPYICAEWHNGGLPVWLTGMAVDLRSSDERYLTEVTAYLRRVYEIVAPRQIDRGGRVVLVQIENEYGAYGSDARYLEELVRVTKDAGITVPLTTVDQPLDRMLEDGSLDTLHRTGSFGSRVAERLATLREHQSTGPLMCSEFWDGWFDWWGGVHHTTDAATAASDLDALLAAGASVNIYMFHGGTNFGTTNGANHKGRYLPLATSYDYDAPLDEAGNPTAKFHAFREVLAKYTSVPTDAVAAATPAPEFAVPLTPGGSWTDAAPAASLSEAPPTFDALGTLDPLVRYETSLDGRGGLLSFTEVRDLAWVSVDGVSVGRISRSLGERALAIPAGETLSVLVEDQGRVNYDHHLGEEKGLIGPALLDGAPLTGWTATPVAAAAEAALTPVRAGTPTMWQGSFELDAGADLFLETTGWGKGFAFVNGFALGRYWRTGPAQTLYVPAPVTHAGRNTVTVLELEHLLSAEATFVSAPLLGPHEE
ncbi:beta-galactosidase family protein [Microbacterium istanbulense]|uniref:Beta-galactosidase family protein n=1 Tax=Microbacterium istanbulense TaxID=3122049 RepID=A0ABU8LKB4_9MICO